MLPQYFSSNKSSIIRTQGKFLIAGGLGNMGFLISKYNADVILIGRKSNYEIEQDLIYSKRLHELKLLKAETVYQQVDICNLKEVKFLKEQIGKINGIIHLGGNVNTSDLELKIHHSSRHQICFLLR